MDPLLRCPTVSRCFIVLICKLSKHGGVPSWSLYCLLFDSLLLAAATFALSSKIARALPVFRGRVFLSKRVGGLGHVAIQYAAKFGYTVAAISRGSDKKDHCLELGVRVALGETCTLCYRVRIHSGCGLGVPVESLNESFLPSLTSESAVE